MAVATEGAQTDGREVLFQPIPDSPQQRALQSNADITIFGGANGGAKTATLVASAGRGVYAGDGGWTAAVFRRTYPELTQLGGVVDQSKKFYPNPSEYYNKNERKYEYSSGARVKFSHLQYEEDKETWDGAELAFVGFDQLESFTRSQFTYLLGRLRAPESAFEPHCFATCNPTGEKHWLYEFLAWWFDEDGDSPLSAHAIQVVDDIPDDVGIPVRYWDMADTDANADSAEQASHTAGIRGVGLTRQWTICQHADIQAHESCSYWCRGEPEGEKCPKCGHETLDTRQRDILLVTHATWFQLEGSDKENRICAVASQDGEEVHVGIEQEGGSSGKDVLRHWSNRLLPDHTVVGDKPTGEKRDRMDLWIPLAQTGRLWVLRSPRAQDYIDTLVDMEPMDVLDATSGVAKLALDDERIDGPSSTYLGSVSF